MELNETRWEHIQSHATYGDRKAPKAVIVAIATVLGGAQINASWTRWETSFESRKTVWTTWVVTDKTLGYVSVTYDLDEYDLQNECNGEMPTTGLTTWARPLSHITGIEPSVSYGAADRANAWYPAASFKVIFPDEPITIGDGGFPVEDRPEADLFFEALRNAIGW